MAHFGPLRERSGESGPDPMGASGCGEGEGLGLSFKPKETPRMRRLVDRAAVAAALDFDSTAIGALELSSKIWVVAVQRPGSREDGCDRRRDVAAHAAGRRRRSMRWRSALVGQEPLQEVEPLLASMPHFDEVLRAAERGAQDQQQNFGQGIRHPPPLARVRQGGKMREKRGRPRRERGSQASKPPGNHIFPLSSAPPPR